jgi:iron-sulfur cluster repair protein YtfE (RIC family)
MKFKDLSKEKLEKLIKYNNSLSGILREMGIKCNSGNYQTLHKYAKNYNLSLNEILNNNSKYKKNRNGTKYDISEILIENSSYGNTYALKNRLYDEGLKKPICEKCGQNEWWYGEKMSLIIDHINGIHDDNRLENLRILCPNCNATLPTHCGKNRKKTKKIKNKLSNFEKRELNIKRSYQYRKTERPPYNVLKNDINELGFLGTGRKYGVSDNSIRKWIKFYEKYEI